MKFPCRYPDCPEPCVAAKCLCRYHWARLPAQTRGVLLEKWYGYLDGTVSLVDLNYAENLAVGMMQMMEKADVAGE